MSPTSPILARRRCSRRATSFVAKLQAVDPSLVNDFQECLKAIIAPLQEMNAELGAETRQVRESLGTKKKSKERAR